MPAIVIGLKLTCWNCGNTGHHSPRYSEKKASGVLVSVDPNPSLIESVISVSSAFISSNPFPAICAKRWKANGRMAGRWQDQREYADSGTSVSKGKCT